MMKRLTRHFTAAGLFAVGLLAGAVCAAQDLPASNNCHVALQALGAAEDTLMASAAASAAAASQATMTRGAARWRPGCCPCVSAWRMPASAA
ncbi:hypothetical protein [Roseateles puraquae]|uniref:hypothetical protein n=1 Tax=Roseateles puraquae TaxID=431059 RepID=UPI0031D92BF9